MKTPKFNVDFKAIREKARDLVVSKIGEQISGPEKASAVVNELAAWVDEQIEWGDGPVGRVLEIADGPVTRAILVLFVQFVYDELKEAGKIT